MAIVRPAFRDAGGERHLRGLGVVIAEDDVKPQPEL